MGWKYGTDGRRRRPIAVDYRRRRRRTSSRRVGGV